MTEESESLPRLIELLYNYNNNSPDKPNTIKAIKTIINIRKNKMIEQIKSKGKYTETTPELETQMELTVLANKFKMSEDNLHLLILFCQQEYHPDEIPKVIKDRYSGGKKKSRKSKKRRSKKSKKSRKSKKRRSRK